ncbi:MAG: hypothetical protein JNJ84_14270, partial [Rhodobacteraceae bacterium]|nr:hypothetical protein [Paracoccaceae bacterium]
MQDKTGPSQAKTPKPASAAETREARLKAALKANMGRRKAQARARNDSA